MRGSDQRSGELFSYVDIEARVPMRHPLRAIRSIVNQGLASLDGEFDKLYADTGRDSIPPERLLRAALLAITTCSTAGSWGWGWTMPCGTTRCSPRTATGCWRPTWRASSWRRC